MCSIQRLKMEGFDLFRPNIAYVVSVVSRFLSNPEDYIGRQSSGL